MTFIPSTINSAAHAARANATQGKLRDAKIKIAINWDVMTPEKYDPDQLCHLDYYRQETEYASFQDIRRESCTATRYLVPNSFNLAYFPIERGIILYPFRINIDIDAKQDGDKVTIQTSYIDEKYTVPARNGDKVFCVITSALSDKPVLTEEKLVVARTDMTESQINHILKTESYRIIDDTLNRYADFLDGIERQKQEERKRIEEHNRKIIESKEAELGRQMTTDELFTLLAD